MSRTINFWSCAAIVVPLGILILAYGRAFWGWSPRGYETFMVFALSLIPAVRVIHDQRQEALDWLDTFFPEKEY